MELTLRKGEREEGRDQEESEKKPPLGHCGWGQERRGGGKAKNRGRRRGVGWEHRGGRRVVPWALNEAFGGFETAGSLALRTPAGSPSPAEFHVPHRHLCGCHLGAACPPLLPLCLDGPLTERQGPRYGHCAAPCLSFFFSGFNSFYSGKPIVHL